METSLPIKRDKVQVVVIFCLKNTYELLLLQTNEKRGSFWQNVTGGVEEYDADIISAAKRELKEELNLNASEVINLDLQFSFHDQWNTQVTESSFLAIISDSLKKKISLDPNEHQNYKIINATKVTKSDYKYSSNYEAFEKSMDNLKGKGLIR
jgi:8-oxo-dGTP pyrophosphatase MutT (NUDIX family)